MENLKSILKNVSDIVLIEQTEQKEKWERRDESPLRSGDKLYLRP